MKVLLLKDVYKLGRAGDVKKVADGFGRNYLLPQGLGVLATPGALKQVEYIRRTSAVQREKLNQELGSVAERLEGLKLVFPAKAGETGKLYGSITTAMMAEAILKETGTTIDRRQLDSQPIKTLGVHKAHVRLTIDLVPEITVLVHREGEAPESAYAIAEAEAAAVEGVGEFVELEAELEAEEAEAAAQAAPSEANEEAKPESGETEATEAD
jgi:large subunit ribosomal protein L9